MCLPDSLLLPTMRFPILFAVALALTAPLLPAQDPLGSITPAHAEMLRDAMRSFMKRDFERAIAQVDKADAMDKPNPVSMNIRGAIAIEQRQFDEGRKYCLQALNEDPKFYPARFNLAEIPFVQGKYAESRVLFEKLSEQNPKDELVQFRIFLTYLLEKDEVAAQQKLDAVQFYSRTPIYYFSHAAWEFAHGNKAEALKWMERGRFVFSNRGDAEFPGRLLRSGLASPSRRGARSRGEVRRSLTYSAARSSRIFPTRFSKSTGLVRCRTNPASRARWTSSSMPKPLSAMPRSR